MYYVIVYIIYIHIYIYIYIYILIYIISYIYIYIYIILYYIYRSKLNIADIKDCFTLVVKVESLKLFTRRQNLCH